MRLIAAMCGLAAFALAQSAAAVTLAPISYSPEFESELHDELGVREGDILRGHVEQAVNAALARRGVSLGASGGSIEIVIVDAEPNRPTMAQLSARPGLDFINSVSIGGAELRAVLRGDDGGAVTEVEHRGYNYSLSDAVNFAPSTWSEARRSIRRFADKVADAYVAHFGAR